ncbi:MAG: hypothetical protein AABZ14_04585 [Candidatus Margulisiibacteriota bacterium]
MLKSPLSIPDQKRLKVAIRLRQHPARVATPSKSASKNKKIEKKR